MGVKAIGAVTTHCVELPRHEGSQVVNTFGIVTVLSFVTVSPPLYFVHCRPPDNLVYWVYTQLKETDR